MISQTESTAQYSITKEDTVMRRTEKEWSQERKGNRNKGKGKEEKRKAGKDEKGKDKPPDKT